jgi:hypothetical protein
MDLIDSDLAKQELDYYRLTDLAKSDLEQAKKFSDYCIARSLSTKDYYDRISK